MVQAGADVWLDQGLITTSGVRLSLSQRISGVFIESRLYQSEFSHGTVALGVKVLDESPHHRDMKQPLLVPAQCSPRIGLMNRELVVISIGMAKTLAVHQQKLPKNCEKVNRKNKSNTSMKQPKKPNLENSSLN